MSFLATRKYSLTAQLLFSISAVVFVAGLCFWGLPFIGYKTVALLLLMSVSILAILFEIIPVLVASTLSALIWNYFFIPPLYTFEIHSTEDGLMFILYFAIASVNTFLTIKIRKEEERARDKEEKGKTIELYNTLLHSLSHELRTPIATILGSAESLKQQELKLQPAQQAELLNQIEIAGDRLNRQVENLLNMSRLETGIFKPNLDWCDVNELVLDCIEKVKRNIGGNIHYQVINPMPLMRTDRTLLEQILENLLHNAVFHSQGEARVDISVAVLPDIFIFEVLDNGNGISDESIGQIFDKFYRSPNSKSGGTGLGLSIVKGFAESMGGEVRYARVPSGGSRFTLRMPAEQSALSTSEDE